MNMGNKEDVIEINGDNLLHYLGLEIIAFHWAARGACGEHGGVFFITRSGQVYHTNYAYPEFGISMDDLCKLFPPQAEFQVGVFGGGCFPREWKDQYLGLGNYLVIHESIWDEFTREARLELKERENNGENVILYRIWDSVVLRVLEQRTN